MASRIYRIVKYVEDRFSSFAVSRLIMLSGVRVRLYTEDSVDDPQATSSDAATRPRTDDVE